MCQLSVSVNCLLCVGVFVYSSGMYVGLNANHISYWMSNNIYHWRMLYKYQTGCDR